MTKKTFYIIALALVLVALAALLWWWFLGRTSQALPPSGAFGTAQNNTPVGGAQTSATNIATPTVAGLGNLSAGTYVLKAPNGTTVGSYTLTPPTQAGGAYTANTSLPAGQYVVYSTSGQALGTYTVAGSNATAIATSTPTPYLGNINTSGVNWFSTSSSTTNSPGTAFNPTAINQINGSNPSGGLLPNFDASLGGKNNGGLGLAGALIGAVGIGVGVCGAQLAASYAAGALGLGVGATSAAASATGAGVAGANALVGASGVSSAAALPVVTEPVMGGVDAVGSGAATAGGAGGSAGAGGGSALASVLVVDFPALIGQVMQGITLSGILTTNTGILAGNTAHNAKTDTTSFMDCVTRGIARAALQQITTSVVNWINSGFSGNPSFVTNPTQFFTNVADVAAGQFIQGSALSFLCSPFKLQIRVAIAYSYANRNAMSCTLTGITNNINNFMNGSFNSGGWPQFLSFTMTPTNNPYGAYAYAQNGLNSSIANAQNNFSVQLNQGRGFLSMQQKQNCKNTTTAPANVNANQYVQSLGVGTTVLANGTVTSKPDGSGNIASVGNNGSSGNIVVSGGMGPQQNQSVTAQTAPGYMPDASGNVPDVTTGYEVCDLVTTTPGSVIAGILDKNLGVGQDSLNMAKNFDEIISALLTQLMTNVLQGGLTNMSGGNGTANSTYYTADQQAAQTAGQALITQMQADTTNNQQLGTIMQGMISDIQNAQSQLNDLGSCWNGAVAKAQAVVTSLQSADSSNASSTASANLSLAEARAQAVATTLASYETQVTNLNNQITQINNSIALLEQYQSRAMSVGSTAEVSQLSNEYLAASVHVTQTDLTTQQQNRTSLQSQLATLGTNITTSTTQCNAI